jgi:hypothetical protein
MLTNNNIYIAETPLHLYLSMLSVNKENYNTIIIDYHRISQQKLSVLMMPFLKGLFKNIIYVHDYEQIGDFNKSNTIGTIKYLFKLNADVNLIVRSIDGGENITLNVFTLNRLERIMINKFYSRSSITVNVLEDGIGTYTRPEHILGLDYSNKTTSFIYNKFRLLFNLSINPSMINLIKLSEPRLIQFNPNIFPIRIVEAEFNLTNITEISEDIKHLIKSTKDFSSPEFVYMSNNINVEEELLFFNKYFNRSMVQFKFHPSYSIENNNSLILWELYQMLFNVNYIFSYGSSSGLVLLNILENINTKYVFLFELYSKLGHTWFSYEEESLLIYKYKELYPENIRIPKSIIELKELLSEISN